MSALAFHPIQLHTLPGMLFYLHIAETDCVYSEPSQGKEIYSVSAFMLFMCVSMPLQALQQEGGMGELTIRPL